MRRGLLTSLELHIESELAIELVGIYPMKKLQKSHKIIMSIR